MLFESQEFEARFVKPARWQDHVFQYCTFKNFDTEGGDVDSIFVACRFDDCEWYWGLFNCAVFVQVTFTNCTFRGTAFGGCKFVECEFIGCKFVKDNLDAECSFNGNAWYGCSQEGCSGLTAF